MFEFGRPSHIFDLDKIHGGLIVRWGQAGESLKLLNGNTIELDANVGVIADHEGVESLAGIMGGDATAVSDDTKNVYVEAAFWWPEAVAGRSRRFNFSTDAGYRFERGVDPALTVEHIERITRLILEICGGEAGTMDDQTLALPKREAVTLRVERASKVIGMPVTQAQCEGVMRRLGLEFRSEPGRLHVLPPSWRFDLQIEEDLVEEVIRVLGYGLLPETAPQAALTARVRSETSRSADDVRHRLAGLDYQETINFSFVEERWENELAGNAQPIRLVNPMASQLAVMRSSLLGSLIGALKFNVARRASRVRVFEVGRVFARDGNVASDDVNVGGVAQPMRIAALAAGPADNVQWGAKERPVDFFDIRGDVGALLAPARATFVADTHPAMHPGRCARVELDGHPIGFVGELHPRWRQAYELPNAPVLFELDLAAVQRRTLPAFAPIPRLQPVWRDLALIAGENVTHDALLGAIRSASTGGLVRSARLFDVYKPAQASAEMAPGERSLAVRLELLDDETSLTDERVDAALKDLLATLTERLGVRLRA
jgi:phenylalanyl-tRNA synthetase beta chain